MDIGCPNLVELDANIAHRGRPLVYSLLTRSVVLSSIIYLFFYGRTLSDASMLYFADFFYLFFYSRLCWPNG